MFGHVHDAARKDIQKMKNEVIMLNVDPEYPRIVPCAGDYSKEDNEGKNKIQQKNFAKITEKRGNGPVLRENSLKLIANSTLCIFQWNKSRYRCFCCQEPFSNIDLLRNHTINTHTLQDVEKKIITQQNRLVKVEISNLFCNICNKKLVKLNDLRSHLIEYHKIDFKSDENLLVPFKINDNLQCQICYEDFNVFRLLNIHMNRHFLNHICHICGSGFSNLVFLNIHRLRNHRPLKCKECGLTFENKSEKKIHESDVHEVNDKVNDKILRYPCPYCTGRFLTEKSKIQHMVAEHGMKKPEYKCMVCQKTFLTKSLCNNHKKYTHLKERKHECEVCHNRFYTKSDVARHKITHTGEKKHVCNLCNNLFATRDSLKKHRKRTHGCLQ